MSMNTARAPIAVPEALNIQSISLKRIRRDGSTQARAALDPDTVAEYRQILDELPPPILYHDGKDHWPGDGLYRLAAHEQEGHKHVVCEIRRGGRREALLCNIEANARHGMRFSNEDKHRAVGLLLDDAEWADWTDREIARRCGVSQPFVSRLRSGRVGIDNGYQSGPGESCITESDPELEAAIADLPPEDQDAIRKAALRQAVKKASGLVAVVLRLPAKVVEQLDGMAKLTEGGDRSAVVARLVRKAAAKK